MAGDAAFPSTTCMTLFFSLLLGLAFHFTVAVPEHGFSPLTSTKDGAIAKKRSTMVAASAREGSTQNFKTDMARKETAMGTHDQLQGPERGRPRAPRPPLQWQSRTFNASAHEVPSGPNPISNSGLIWSSGATKQFDIGAVSIHIIV